MNVQEEGSFVGLQLPRRHARSSVRVSRVLGATVLAVTALLLAGCSDDTEAGRLAMPKPATEDGQHTLDLWQGAWIAALATGVVVWGLIFYVVWRFRRRSDDEIPVQTRYNLPLEIFYTIAPVIMVIVFFKATVHTQDIVLDDSVPPAQTIEVVGQQWSWTFNYPVDDDSDGTTDRYAYEVGTASHIPDLYLPVDSVTRFNLHSPDVIHDFGVPAFLMRMDVIPGRVNHYQVKPIAEGDYDGKCYELCGVYHSRMLFNVHVVSQFDYQSHLQQLIAAGQVSEEPLLGGSEAITQAGLDDEGAQQ